MREKWLPVDGYEGVYEVSNIGRVRRVCGGRGSIAGRILTCKTAPNGYQHVDLSIQDKKTRFLIHRLVATAFLGKPDFNAEVNHKDGIKTNNRMENLEWVTRGQNISHAYRTSLRVHADVGGSKNPRAKLTEAQVKEIRELKGVIGQREIAKRYGVARTTIQWIHQGKHWK
jgi:hypothetical protein